MYYPNYRDFYQKALIPIGVNDHNSLLSWSPNEADASHWLIALEGLPQDYSNFYKWKVVVFPANVDGNFQWKKPIYTSLYYECFHKAYDAAKEIENQTRKDVLYSSNLQEKIS